MTTEVDAWFLHKYPVGNTSLKVSLFTKKQGVVSCLYKGGRTPKKQAVLQAFMPLWVALENRSDWYYLQRIESVTAPFFFEKLSLFSALYVNELIYYALKPLDPHPSLFETYEYTLKALSTVSDRLVIESLLRQFELVLLDECGYALCFSHEAVFGVAIDAERYYRFIPGYGFQLAEQGLSGRAILGIAQGQLDQISVLKTAKLIMRLAINHLLNGQEIKSRGFFVRGE